MNVRTLKLGSILGAALLAAIGLLPSLALADEPRGKGAPSFFASAVAYEVAEHLRFKGGMGDPASFAVRLAKASLLGEILGSAPDAGSPFVVGDFIDADANSSVSAATGTGPIIGTFNTLHDFDPTTKSLSTMLVTATGTLRGELDLRPLFESPPRPVAFLNNAHWRVNDDLRGPLVGVFLIPFNPVDAVLAQVAASLAGLPPATQAAILAGVKASLESQFAALHSPSAFVYPTGGPLNSCAFGATPDLSLSVPSGPTVNFGAVCPVTQDEILLGFPLTKVELVLQRR